MTETIGKIICINHSDKGIINWIIKIAIDKEVGEIKRIEEKGKQLLNKPEELKSFLKLRPIMISEHSLLKRDIEKLKEKIENLPMCK